MNSLKVNPRAVAQLRSYPSRRWLSNTPKRTCLYEFHQKRHAKLEPFAGYLMPIVYKGQTIKSEHMQTRNESSVFDVSHMMQTIVRGKDANKFMERLTVADIEQMTVNRCSLSVFTNDRGGVIDDCIIAKNQSHLHVVSNAGNSETVWTWLNQNKDDSKQLDVQLERLDGRGLIALQGPSAARVLQALVKIDLDDLEFMSTTKTNLDGVGACMVTRCGYTGEDGFEISVESRQAETLMELLCRDERVKPAGLGARDTLRLEAGLCLHGHDLTDQITPVEAALSWTIHKRRRIEAGFLGSHVILDQLKSGPTKRRTGLICTSGGPPAREGCPVERLDKDNEQIGLVTSGTFAPKLEKNIAMAYVPIDVSKKVGEKVACKIRGKGYTYAVAKMPFVQSNYYVKK